MTAIYDKMTVAFDGMTVVFSVASDGHSVESDGHCLNDRHPRRTIRYPRRSFRHPRRTIRRGQRIFRHARRTLRRGRRIRAGLACNFVILLRGKKTAQTNCSLLGHSVLALSDTLCPDEPTFVVRSWNVPQMKLSGFPRTYICP